MTREEFVYEMCERAEQYRRLYARDICHASDLAANGMYRNAGELVRSAHESYDDAERCLRTARNAI